MVPHMVYHTLLSARKFVNSDYIPIYDGDEVKIYNGQTSKIEISEAGVLKY